IVAHDLRNPVSTIRLSVQTLQRHAARGEDGALGPALGAMAQAAARAEHLIRDLLDATQLDRGRLSLSCAPVDAAALVGDAVNEQRTLGAEASCELGVDAPEDLPAVLADRERILQVFENLLGNALKFTPRGGRIVAAAAAKPGEVLFSVSD